MNKNIIITIIVAVAIALGAWALIGGQDNGENGSTASENGGATTDGSDSEGTLEISFLGEQYSFGDASCRSRRAFPPENEQMGYRNVDENVEFWVERYDPEESDVVEVHMAFPSGGANETIGEVEAYEGRTTIDEVTFEIGQGSTGSVQLDPTNHMDDDIEYVEDGGIIEWNLSC